MHNLYSIIVNIGWLNRFKVWGMLWVKILWHSLCEEFGDIKGVIRIRKSKKDRQHNGPKKRDKRTNNNLQNTTQKTKDWAAGASIKPRGELRCSGPVNRFCSTSGTRRVTLVTNPVTSHEYEAFLTSRP
jgi:hypothetical protein